MSQTLFSPITLPNGVTIKNRICKASMEENMAEYGQIPGVALFTLYEQWARGGTGLILTGNVMVAPNALTGAGGVVLEDDTNLARFEQWASAARQNACQVWMQISHPGRQIYANLGEQALSPSDIALDMGNFSNMFATPRAMSEAEIENVIKRFGNTARLAERAGFDGVEIHGAHGYLISQFLSPLVNRRNDQWGGELANRARFLFEIVQSVRGSVGSRFCVGVKLNSADFQRGGFDKDDARWVAQQLNGMGVDLIELSGGSYESPAMQGNARDDSTGLREAYFIDFAREIAKVVDMPVMVTGGIKRRVVAEQALVEDGAMPPVDMVGIATALAYHPDLPNCWQQDAQLEIAIPEIRWKNRMMTALGRMALTKLQMHRLSKGKSTKAIASPMLALIGDRMRANRQTRRYRRWRSVSHEK